MCYRPYKPLAVLKISSLLLVVTLSVVGIEPSMLAQSQEEQSYGFPVYGVEPADFEGKLPEEAGERFTEILHALDLDGWLFVFGYEVNRDVALICVRASDGSEGEIYQLEDPKLLDVRTLPSGDDTSEFSFIHPKPTFLGGFEIASDQSDIGESLVAVFLLYTIDYSGGTIQNSTTYLETFVVGDVDVVFRGDREEVAQEDAMLVQIDSDRHSEWFSFKEWYEEDLKEPGLRKESRLLFKDVQGDGWRDLVLWSRVFRSSVPEGESGERVENYEWPMTESRLEFKPYLPEKKAFGPLRGAPEEVPKPPDELWWAAHRKQLRIELP